MSSNGSAGRDAAYGVDDPPNKLEPRRGSRVHPEDVARADKWKETQFKIWTLFENPQSSKAAFTLSFVLLMLILISCVAFCLQTIPKFYAGDQAVWDGIEMVCIVCFTLEYGFRLAASPHRMSFCMAPLNIIDLVAIAPFYIEKVVSLFSATGDVSGLAVFRIIRLARVFRLFKLGRYSDGLKTFANTMARSTRPLAMLVFFMIIAIILFSSAIYYCERGAWDEAQREWWRDEEVLGGRFEMLTACNSTVTSVEVTPGSLDVELAHFEPGADSGWVPKLVNDFVEFPTGYIEEGTGVAYREQDGTFTAIYRDSRQAGDAQPTGEDVVSEMEFVAEWATDGSCRSYPVEDDNQDSWQPTGVGRDCKGDNAYIDGMGVELREEGREVFPEQGKERIAGEGSDLRNRVALAIAAGLPPSEAAPEMDYRITLSLTTTCKEIGCLYCLEPSPFNSIPASFYWAAVTMTTVGYGDVYPTTTAGQFVASLTMMVGILILALPITVIGTYFAAEYEEYLRRQKIDADYHERLAKKRELAAASARDGVSDRGLGVAMSQANSNQDPEDPSAKATREHAATLDDQMSWLHEHEPINVYDEMDWIANRSRAELRATLEQIIRQERDNLVMKLNSVVQRYTRQMAD